MRLAFGTNGLSNHRLDDAFVLLADLGYDGVALTLDTMHLDPYAENDLPQVRRRLEDLGLALVIETGGRFVIDPRCKHHPTLLDEPDLARRRIDFLGRAINIAAELGAEAVSLWSGVAPTGVGDDELWDRLAAGVEALARRATRAGVAIGVEPEPGMFVDTIARWERLRAFVGPGVGMTLDLGHCHCLERETISACIERVAHALVDVHIEDMRRGVHEHLEFGDGEVDVASALATLDAVGYTGLVGVEMPRFSHDGPGVARRSIEHLRDRGARR